MNQKTATWFFEELTTAASGISGNIADQFKKQTIETAEILRSSEPPNAATLLAREIIQNSQDSAIERADDDPDAALEMSFEFSKMERTARVEFAESLDLGKLTDQIEKAGGWSHVDVTKAGFEALINTDKPLRVLKITERHTTGMYGSWDQSESKMWFAMLSIGYNEKRAGSGGTAGRGKSTIAAASATRSVFAYTCFGETKGDEGTTRRFLGVNYLKGHEADRQRFTGWARFGAEQPDGTAPSPFTNEDADRIAESLGMEIRDPSNPQDLGTTFLLLEPVIEPLELLSAIERNWYMAIVDENGFDIIFNSEGAKGRNWPK